MTEQETEKRPAGEHAAEAAATTTTAAVAATAATRPAKRRRPLTGFLVAGASLALLFGIAALKGRVTDDNTDSERGLQ